jgi:DNA polymerase III delta prime subunit
MTDTERRAFITKLAELGTKKSACLAVGITPWLVRSEENHSAVFKRKVEVAKAEGIKHLADQALENIRAIAFGEIKADKTVLTANLALANAYESGFKGVQRTEGHVDYNIRVITGVPRPNYEAIDKPKPKLLKEGAIEEDGNET